MALKFPPIYLLKYNFKLPDLFKLGDQIGVVTNIKEADLVLGDITFKRRAQLELRSLGVYTEDITEDQKSDRVKKEQGHKLSSPKKRLKVETNSDGKDVISLDSDSDTASETDTESEGNSRASSATATSSTPVTLDSLKKDENTIKVLKLAWYYDSVKAGQLLPIEKYLVYEGRINAKPTSQWPEASKPTLPASILSGGKAPSVTPVHCYKNGHGSRVSPAKASQRPHLHKQTTSDEEFNRKLPPLPEYLNSNYSCERLTPLHTPNDDFIAQLKTIEHARILTNDDDNTSAFSDRAYSKAISAIAAYPYKLRTSKEVLRLPGVGEKMTSIWEEWNTYGSIKEVHRINNDEKLNICNTFWNIYDVGPKTARDWYDKGCRDLDDVAKIYSGLSRTQKLGFKFYEEFEERIPREEVKRIGDIVLKHANELRPGFQMVICGGYRRGKTDSGDVDVILTNPDESKTHEFLMPLLDSLEVWEDEDDVKHGYITHTLRYSESNSRRNQTAVPWKGSMPKHLGKGKGFDTLDTMFVAWQDPAWPSKAEDLKKDPEAKDPNIHRRVDIIITPWKTAGCAIIGWTGGTMFERDLRQYCRDKWGYKFDSSGVRRVDNGDWVDLEAGVDDLLAKEKKVFERLGLTWREPTERCTD
jgi:DNA polymerase IV